MERRPLWRTGDTERAIAISCAVFTRDARVAAGWPIREEKDAAAEGDVYGIGERERERPRPFCAYFWVGVASPPTCACSLVDARALAVLADLGGCEWEWPCSRVDEVSTGNVFTTAGNTPWKRNKPTMLEARPSEPTITTNLGLDISANEGHEIPRETRRWIKRPYLES